MNKTQTGIIILAAGSSTRMGSPKQLLEIDGRPLIVNAARAALDSLATCTVVVIGSNAEKIKPLLMTLGVQTVVNNEWANGMGSSLKTGLRFLLDTNPDLNAMVVMVADQPLVSTNVINGLIELSYQSAKSIVASGYQNTLGVPALFKRKYFHDLLELPDETGAKKLLLTFMDDVVLIPFPHGIVDLDTPEDYQRFLNPE